MTKYNGGDEYARKSNRGTHSEVRVRMNGKSENAQNRSALSDFTSHRDGAWETGVDLQPTRARDTM
jgi:hypothetical protein